MENLLTELSRPFHPSEISFKPGATKGDRALALAYANLRVYMSRLDEVCGMDWSIEYKPWGNDRIIACLTINGTTRCSTGEMAAQDEKNEMGGTVAEAQAAKRACAMFGLGRYLYDLPTGWAEFDPAKKQFTDAAKAKLTGILTQHYREATAGKATQKPTAQPTTGLATTEQIETLNALGLEFYGEDKWEKQLSKIVEAVSTGVAHKAEELKPREVEILIEGIKKRIAEITQKEEA
jgi:hypothetical protein